MLTRPVPSSGEPLPVIGLGTWQTFDRPVNGSLVETVRALHAAGGTLVDSSPMYGRAERTIGEAAERAGLNGDLFIATKVWTRGEQEGIRQMNESFRLLRRDVVDLIQVHNLVDWRVHLATLRRWKNEGRVRYIGVTHYTASAHAELEAAIRAAPIDFVQVNYSPLERHAERSLLRAAADHGVAVIINRPFAEGVALRRLLDAPLPQTVASWASSWPEAFLKFIIARPEVTCVIPATSNPAHMAANARAGEGGLPNDDQRRALLEAIK
jgi:diketogulonate reductase-like aldo/keto reductase